MLGSLARSHGVPLVYVNQVGGNDDLVFDGRSCVFDAGRRVVARGRRRSTETSSSSISSAPAADAASADVAGEVGDLARAGARHRATTRASAASRDALLGLSGGIDSALTAAIAAEALGADHVLGVLMPSPFSSQGSVDDALALAARLGIDTLTLPIADVMRAFDDDAAPAPSPAAPRDVTEENIQARIRGNLLMALSNKRGALLLTTGNKSELAVGYCTLYGDMSGGLAVIADVPKTMVYRVSRVAEPARGAGHPARRS